MLICISWFVALFCLVLFCFVLSLSVCLFAINLSCVTFPKRHKSQARTRGCRGKLPPGLQALSLIQPQGGRLVHSGWALGVRPGWGMSPYPQGPCSSSHFTCRDEAYVGRSPGCRGTKVTSQHIDPHTQTLRHSETC